MGLVEAHSELPNFYAACWKHHTLSLAQVHTIVSQSSGFNSNAERRFMLDVNRGKKKNLTLLLLMGKFCNKSLGLGILHRAPQKQGREIAA